MKWSISINGVVIYRKHVFKAKSRNIEYLFMDELSLRQFQRIDPDELVAFTEFFGMIRVVTTFWARGEGPSSVKTSNSYQRRAMESIPELSMK